MDLAPFRQAVELPGARRMNREDVGPFLEALKQKSAEIKDDAFIQNQWLICCEEKKHRYPSTEWCRLVFM
jgi:hypothetical protein